VCNLLEDDNNIVMGNKDYQHRTIDEVLEEYLKYLGLYALRRQNGVAKLRLCLIISN